jgi:hypothetical protein
VSRFANVVVICTSCQTSVQSSLASFGATRPKPISRTCSRPWSDVIILCYLCRISSVSNLVMLWVDSFIISTCRRSLSIPRSTFSSHLLDRILISVTRGSNFPLLDSYATPQKPLPVPTAFPKKRSQQLSLRPTSCHKRPFDPTAVGWSGKKNFYDDRSHGPRRFFRMSRMTP